MLVVIFRLDITFVVLQLTSRPFLYSFIFDPGEDCALQDEAVLASRTLLRHIEEQIQKTKLAPSGLVITLHSRLCVF